MSALTTGLTDAENAALADVSHYFDQDAGHSNQQSTRPQTLGYGLVDSAVAAGVDPGEALVVERHRRRSDPSRHR
ncbi:MAG: hypothetical protein ACR2MN_12105 [Acidimicrobiales bacterium]